MARELPDPNAGDDLAYQEAWDDRIRDEQEQDEEPTPERPLENKDEV